MKTANLLVHGFVLWNVKSNLKHKYWNLYFHPSLISSDRVYCDITFSPTYITPCHLSGLICHDIFTDYTSSSSFQVHYQQKFFMHYMSPPGYVSSPLQPPWYYYPSNFRCAAYIMFFAVYYLVMSTYFICLRPQCNSLCPAAVTLVATNLSWWVNFTLWVMSYT